MMLEEVKREFRGECEEDAAAKYSNDENDERFAKSSHSGFHLLLTSSKLSCRPEGEKAS